MAVSGGDGQPATVECPELLGRERTLKDRPVAAGSGTISIIEKLLNPGPPWLCFRSLEKATGWTRP